MYNEWNMGIQVSWVTGNMVQGMMENEWCWNESHFMQINSTWKKRPFVKVHSVFYWNIARIRYSMRIIILEIRNTKVAEQKSESKICSRKDQDALCIIDVMINISK